MSAWKIGCRRVSWMVVVASAAMVLASTPAKAHPHIWIDVVATFVFDGKNVTGVKFQWVLDDFFSAGVIGSFDADKNRVLDDKEQVKIKAEAFDGSKDSNYFSDIRIKGETYKIRQTTEFSAEIKKGQVVYRFTVPFETPVDPTEDAVSVSVYDKSFFVDINFVKDDPIRFEGLTDGSCHFILDEDRDNPIYFGVVFPGRADLLCGKN